LKRKKSETNPEQAITSNAEMNKKTDEPSKPLHVRIVFFGTILLVVILTPLLLDTFFTAFTSWLISIAGFDIYLSMIIITSVRVVGIVFLIMIIWGGYLGIAIYHRRFRSFFIKILLIGIGLILLFCVNIAFSFIFFFLFFLWTPKPLTHWSEKKLRFYRVIVLGIIIGWIVIESVLSSGIIGRILIRPTLTNSLANLLQPIGLASLCMIGIIVIIPAYGLLPQIWRSFWKARLRIENFWIEYSRDLMGIIGIILIGSIIVIAIFAPWIAPYHWSQGSLEIGDFYQPPSPLHLLGTNGRGEDIFSRVIYGTQISLIVGFTASVIAVSLGTLMGLAAGYFGGTLDVILMRITDVFLSLPTLPLMLIFLVLFGQGLQNIIIVIAILGWTGTARMVRSETLSLRERPLTEAAHALGASDMHIITRHILPNTLPLILANVILGVVNAILGEAGITFLGFGDIHGQPSWGIVLHWASRGGALLNEAWWWLIPPGVLILITTLGFAFISHSADKVVNPRLRRRRK
jgi:ABC-type dipeptide/oligopeptide/nickel transport system permease subunit